MKDKVYDIFNGKEIKQPEIVFADFTDLEMMLADMLPQGKKFFEATDYQVGESDYVHNPAWDAEDKELI